MLHIKAKVKNNNFHNLLKLNILQHKLTIDEI